MSPANRYAGGIGRNQCRRDAVVFLVADQAIGVTKLEGESEHGRDRRERNVTLVPVELDAGDRLAIPFAFAHHAAINQCGSIGPCLGRGQRETRNLGARSEAREVVVLLFIGAVVQQQFGGTERVRHTDCRPDGGTATA